MVDNTTKHNNKNYSFGQDTRISTRSQWKDKFWLGTGTKEWQGSQASTFVYSETLPL
jgi:hypothetical protein